MFAYYFQLAILNLRKNPWLTALIIVAVAVGIGSSMTVMGLFQAMARDPIPWKSSQLFAPRVDSMGPEFQYFMQGIDSDKPEPYPVLPYKDAVALKEAGEAVRQAVFYPARFTLRSSNPELRPSEYPGIATHKDFFTMFDVPFSSGSAWSEEEDEAAANVIVISEQIAHQMFPDSNAIGETLLVDERSFKVVGVIQRWVPEPQFYDVDGLGNNSFGDAHEVFIPFATAVALYPRGQHTAGNWNCVGYGEFPETNDEWLTGGCAWLNFWVQLSSEKEAQRYQQFLTNYAAEQQALGRFNWEPLVSLHNVREWLKIYKVASDEFRVVRLLGFAFLLVCLVNAISLMLARVHNRFPNLSLRRALGASRRALFAQSLVETAVIGFISGVLGIALTFLGARILKLVLPSDLARLAIINPGLVVWAVAISVLGTVCAGLYPAWQASRVSNAGKQHSRSRNRFGAALVVLQLALTLTIVSNALFICWQRIDQMRQPSGLDEPNIAAFVSSWPSNPPDLAARIERDVITARSIPGVIDASVAYSIPFRFDVGGLGIPMSPTPVEDQNGSEDAPSARTHFMDIHAVNTLGLNLIQGRDFEPQEMGELGQRPPPFVIVNKDFADRVFPNEDAVGKMLYTSPGVSFRIVGVVEQLQDVNYGVEPIASAIIPLPYAPTGKILIAIRSAPGALNDVMKQVEAQLTAQDPTRIISAMETLEESRAQGFQGHLSLVITLVGVCALLLLVTALGIVGLSSYWVSQRSLQIGIRRALGARRHNILSHFQLENLFIASIGVGLGILLALSANLWLVKSFEQQRIDSMAVISGALIILLLGQIAVLWPSLRAAIIPPALATRGG